MNNLLKYATQRYITDGSPLFDYVVSGKAVPLDVFDNELTQLLSDDKTLKISEDVELLIEDYRHYLQSHVKVSFSPISKSNIMIDGDIDDRVMRVICELNNVEPETVIHEVVYGMAKLLNNDKEIRIDNISFDEIVKSELSNGRPEVEAKSDVVDDADARFSFVKVKPVEGIGFVPLNVEKVETVVEDTSLSKEDEVIAADLDTFIDDVLVDEVVSEDVFVDEVVSELVDDVETSVSDDIDEFDIVLTDPEVDEMDDVVSEDVPLRVSDIDATEVVKRNYQLLNNIYTEFADKLRQTGLDERLDISL